MQRYLHGDMSTSANTPTWKHFEISLGRNRATFGGPRAKPRSQPSEEQTYLQANIFTYENIFTCRYIYIRTNICIANIFACEYIYICKHTCTCKRQSTRRIYLHAHVFTDANIFTLQIHLHCSCIKISNILAWPIY